MINELKQVSEVHENFDLKNYNTLKLNSNAKIYISPNNESELKKVIKIINKYNSPYLIIGNASNIILPPFYDGVIIKLDKFNKYHIRNNILYCDSGCMINKIAIEVSDKGYSGFDNFTGVPGTIGGSIYGNAGCYGRCISDILISARIFDGKKIIELNNSDLDFKYRYSNLKENKNMIVLSAKFKLEKASKKELKALIKDRTEKRLASQDLSHPSNGSIFRNPEGLATWKLVDDLGLKGHKVGGAMVSFKHANFIINEGNATQEDIINLINEIKTKVKEEYNIDLVLEQEIIENTTKK